jgi:hypothetical protein
LARSHPIVPASVRTRASVETRVLADEHELDPPSRRRRSHQELSDASTPTVFRWDKPYQTLSES